VSGQLPKIWLPSGVLTASCQRAGHRGRGAHRRGAAALGPQMCSSEPRHGSAAIEWALERFALSTVRDSVPLLVKRRSGAELSKHIALGG
jgi:hypothetical protein